jgi:plastocyanin
MPMSPLPNCSVSLPPPLFTAVVVVVPLSLPQAARKAAAAAEPPVSAMNFRRETGSLTARATAFCGGAPDLSRSVLSGISSLLGWFPFLRFPYATPGAAGSQSAQFDFFGESVIQIGPGSVGVGMGSTPPMLGSARPRVGAACLRPAAPAALLVGFALLLAGCGGGGGGTDSSSSGSAAAPGSSGSGQSSKAVTIKDYTFKPATITVPIAHTATSKESGVFDTEAIQPGKSGSVTLETAGTFTYYCVFHPFMKGTIVVE